MEFDWNILRSGEQTIYRLRGLYEKYGYRRFKMSKFEEYDLYVRNKDFLISDRMITFTDALQAGLHDLLEGAVTLAGAVDVLIVINLPGAGLVLPCVLHDGDGHVGLQGHEDAPSIGEGDHPVADEEVLVADVQVVLLELAHLETAVAVLLI